MHNSLDGNHKQFEKYDYNFLRITLIEIIWNPKNPHKTHKSLASFAAGGLFFLTKPVRWCIVSVDAQGNPVNYLGHTLTWEKGRQLKRFVKSDGTVIDYTYNANGIRTSKTVGGVKHTYILDGANILRETWGDNSLVPIYDNEDSVCGILYNEEPYYFIKNLQGDVIAIVNKDAQTVARYSYDAWGACTVTQDTSDCQIATINPYRYRGYYCDVEIGLYYLQSRYYDASVGRFINADDCSLSLFVGSSTAANLFAYCTNNYVNCHDASGYIPWQVIVVVTAGIVIALAKVLETINSSEYKRATGGGKFFLICSAFVLGFVQGVITALVLLVNKNIFLGVISGIIYTGRFLEKNPKASKYKLLNVFIDGFSIAVITSGISLAASEILDAKNSDVANLVISFIMEELFG